MGNKMASPLCNDDIERVQSIISEFFLDFSKEFPLHYRDAVVDNVHKRSGMKNNEGEYRLSYFPIPDYVIKEGLMYKRGEVNKAWKMRFFCARNQTDNYIVEYYENESRLKRKGIISCCGYNIEDFTPEEEAGYGRYGIKMVPSDSEGRVWWLRCENEDDKAEWTKVLMNACQKSKPPVHSDPLIITAFEATFKTLRWKYKFTGWYRTSYNECEHLVRLCLDIIFKEFPQAVFSETDSSSSKSDSIKSFQKNIDEIVTVAANKAWSAAVAAAISQREVLEAEVLEVHELDDYREQITELVTGMTQDTVGAFFSKIKRRVCFPILHSCENPITNAFVTSIHGFHDYMMEQIREGRFDTGSFGENIVLAHRSVEEWWSGPLEETNQVCWAMYTNDLTDISSHFVAGYSAYNLYSEVLDANRKLMHRALSFFSDAAVRNCYEGLKGILKRVLYLVICDAKLYLKSVLQNILMGFLKYIYEGDVILPCLKSVQSIQLIIDDFPEPNASKFIYLPTLAEGVLWDLLRSDIESVVETSYADNAAEIDTTIAQLGALDA